MLESRNQLFLVLCIHRSGSSMTAGIMQRLGINMGTKLLPASEGNVKGHFENVDFVQINDDILNSAGGSFNKPPHPKNIDELNYPSEKLVRFVQQENCELWGLKDPRTVLTFDIWRPYLEQSTKINYVFVHRSFSSSVSSLSHRDKRSHKKSTKMLTPYLVNLYNIRHNYGLPENDIIDASYNRLIEDPRDFVAAINSRIGNPADANLDEALRFMDESLKHF